MDQLGNPPEQVLPGKGFLYGIDRVLTLFFQQERIKLSQVAAHIDRFYVQNSVFLERFTQIGVCPAAIKVEGSTKADILF